MQVFRISSVEAGRRLDRYVLKQFPHMPMAFLHKQLRGNGFRLNGQRIRDGAVILQEGDTLTVYISEEQAAAFSGSEIKKNPDLSLLDQLPPIVYEDDHLIIFNKPAGMLSQKDSPDAISLTEIGRAYLYANGLEQTLGFQPGVVSRLDRNTSGLVIMGKDLASQQALSEMIRDGSLEKYYYAIVHGVPSWETWTDLIHAFEKDSVQNVLNISDVQGDEKDLARCKVHTLKSDHQNELSLVEIQLITGKSHQIRAQLSFEGFPIVGDPKYGIQGDPVIGQLLLAHELVFRKQTEPFTYLYNQHFYADWPEAMKTLPFGQLWEGQLRS